SEMKELPEDVKKEPFEALYGGEDGLDFYRRIMQASKDHFKGVSHIIFEIGYRQADALRQLTGGKCEIKKDLSDNDRVCIIRGFL
ncbi:MAG: peptide chain release factor N(5)-glutamine methyltransferase, partial [Clostridia bacterium]|nr:peptide chain release factor N(5)-glutamine methyltransferase [Clostridia bacterium]